MLPHQALDALASSTFSAETSRANVLVSSACIGVDSLGNYLGNYLENVACADKIGVAYMAVAKVYEPRTRDASNAFLSALPSLVLPPPSSAASVLSLPKLTAACPCRESCHENPRAVWPKSLATVVRPLLQTALAQHRASLSLNTTVARGDICTAPPETVLPLTPDAAVHYRCGDNFVGHYGFVPFAAVAQRIPASAKTIYVLAEARGRKTAAPAKQHMAGKCDVVLRALHQYLAARFPAAVVLLRRGGDDPYTDLVRLAYAPVTVCSVSTFCLWPALASNNTAYFPITPLILGGTGMPLRQGFVWMAANNVVRGQSFDRLPAAALVKALGGVVVATNETTAKHY